ncbi:MAG: hypothetical protein FMNOHCHN_01632 [Ignavibacteriaceae bacterium]|nr:hypothetical protein [Ignavibacteriaceae bacterium]
MSGFGGRVKGNNRPKEHDLRMYRIDRIIVRGSLRTFYIVHRALNFRSVFISVVLTAV